MPEIILKENQFYFREITDIPIAGQEKLIDKYFNRAQWQIVPCKFSGLVPWVSRYYITFLKNKITVFTHVLNELPLPGAYFLITDELVELRPKHKNIESHHEPSALVIDDIVSWKRSDDYYYLMTFLLDPQSHLINAFLTLVDKNKGKFYIPHGLPNIYGDGRICMGDGANTDIKYHEERQIQLLTHYEMTKMNTDLYVRGDCTDLMSWKLDGSQNNDIRTGHCIAVSNEALIETFNLMETYES